MNPLVTASALALAYLRARALATVLNIVLLALGVATVIALLLTLSQAEERMDRDAAGIDLVVGAKGSPLQLVLSSVFHVDVPTGNIPLAEARRIMAEPAVRRAIPLSLGDSYRGFRLVGSEPALLELYGARLAAGQVWNKSLEVVVGADAARATGLAVGSRFAGSHGLSEGGGDHAARPFTVAGVLAPTGSVIDRLIVTGLDSVWDVHGHAEAATAASPVAPPVTAHAGHVAGATHADADAADDDDREITALLIQYRSPIAAMSFPKRVNAVSGLQAAAPAFETARLFALLGVGATALRVFAAIMMLCAGLGIFIGLMTALDDRRADLALLRVLGADRATVFLTVVLQGFALGAAGVILGVLLGHLGTEWIGSLLGETQRVRISGLVWRGAEWIVIAAALGLAVIAALFPAWRAYREAVPDLLGGRS